MPVERRDQLARASAARAHRDRGVGLPLISLGVAFWLGVFLVFVVLWLAGVNTGNWPTAVGAIVFGVALWLVTRGRRMRVSGAEHVLAADVRAPIVYLRPFGADQAEIATRMSSRLRISPRAGFEKTYEERLARTLRKIGPFVAVGDPTERLPLIGAARMYAADEQWQETVDELTARAGVLLVHAGEGDGLTWEVRHVIELDAPERVILSLPLYAKRKEPTRQARYEAFRRRSGDAFPQPLPEAIGHCQFLYFDADWTPRLLGERGTAPPTGESERARALRRLAREFKIAWAPLWVRTLVYTIAAIAVLFAAGFWKRCRAPSADASAPTRDGHGGLLLTFPPRLRRSAKSPSHKRLLEAKDVVGIVFRLDSQQAVVIIPVIGTRPVAQVGIGEVGIDASRSMGMHDRP
jgi:hypothetical protein